MTELSGAWARHLYPAMESADTATRLALALGPVRSAVRVVNSRPYPMDVNWAAVGTDDNGKPRSMSFTDFANGRIAVNPLPIMQMEKTVAPASWRVPGNYLPARTTAAEAIDIAVGFALHEASHSEESRDRYTDLIVIEEQRVSTSSGTRIVRRERPVFRPMRVALYLWNLVEDVRIEAETSRKWPGFAPYFETVLDYMWTDIAAGHRDDIEYGPKIADKLRVVFMACRYPAKAKDVCDDAADLEIDWWHAWQLDYLAGRTDTRETIRRGLAHLAEDEQASKEMQEMETAEKKEEERGEQLRKQIERLLKEGVKGAPGTCVTHDHEAVVLDREMAEKVDQLVREGLITARPLFTDNDNKCAAQRIMRPEETRESRRAYVGKPTPLTDAMRAALVFRSERPQYDVKLQKSGVMDDEELWRWGTNDYRVFSERVVEARPDVRLDLFVDISGSMCDGYKLPNAQRLAQTALWAVQDQVGVECHVWAHTGDIDHGEGSDVYRVWEPGDQITRLGLLSTLSNGNNYDGFALAYVIDQMRQASQPQKVLIVFSDGIPAGHGYGGSTGMAHVRKVVDWAAREGVTVIQLAIDEDLRPEDQTMMYGSNWVGYKDDASLPRDLTRLLLRHVG